ncbi:hypothetical protein Msil_1448 [Methylocella silvestris BL2]|uniref:MlaB-like STAS domain-containing protein n=1 Tax=Methylocella silvestris (strain DSM 15510 / CIP 108128 / LMG 27833 / NCIMB 13906 / BL2) TaxID=395965 RepID=B8ESS7_METSB|nr:STAS domain-containing protein [Methylocella silvestris]ACK50412.1 hypothetical protein Msil_1448 [Methylocella silvestris BL2]
MGETQGNTAPSNRAQEPRRARIVELPAALDLKAAAPLVAELLACRGDELLVDASRVERLGGQCLQALMSAAMTWKADELPLAIVDASQDFIDGLRRFGVALEDLTDRDFTK